MLGILLMYLSLAMLAACGQDQAGPAPDDSIDHSTRTATTEHSAAVSIVESPPFAATRATLEQAGIADWTSVSLDSTQTQWLPTGVQVEAGTPLSIFGFGTLVLDTLKFEPRNIAWVRVGEAGDVIKLASNQYTFEPEQSGVLYLTIPPLGFYWDNPAGIFKEDMPGFPATPLDMDFVVIEWPDDPREMLQRLSQSDEDIFDLALQRLTNPKVLPDGFSYLWYLGQSEVFDSFEDGERSGVHGHAENDYGIIRKEVELPLTEVAEIEFDWLYTALPAAGPETENQYHDYLSVAVEFDNGQDITWLWSRELDIEQGFRCPLYWWDERETHIVLQSGTEGLDEWYTHRRNILADYAAHVEGEIPERIVGVWFIATSLSETAGDAKFANVSLKGGTQEIELFH